MDQPIELEDIIPEPGEFILRKTGDRVHRLRPINLEDHTWITKNIGDEKRVKEIMEGKDLAELCKLIYHQLEDRAQFPSRLEVQINDEGDEVERKITGPQALAQCVVSKIDQRDLYVALLKTIGISQPILDKILNKDVKKKEEPTP